GESGSSGRSKTMRCVGEHHRRQNGGGFSQYAVGAARQHHRRGFDARQPSHAGEGAGGEAGRVNYGWGREGSSHPEQTVKPMVWNFSMQRRDTIMPFSKLRQRALEPHPPPPSPLRGEGEHEVRDEVSSFPQTPPLVAKLHYRVRSPQSHDESYAVTTVGTPYMVSARMIYRDGHNGVVSLQSRFIFGKSHYRVHRISEERRSVSRTSPPPRFARLPLSTQWRGGWGVRFPASRNLRLHSGEKS